jgi:DegV family protein with EDD domain
MVKVFPGEAHPHLQLQATILSVTAMELMIFRFCGMDNVELLLVSIIEVSGGGKYMTVRIVTDSTADISPEVAGELGITVVPLYVHFGHEVYHDGVDISADEFYRRLMEEAELPKTSAPSSGTFKEAYEDLAVETNEIVSVHISSKLSATYNSALVGKEGVITGCRVEVIDSLTTSIGLGLIVITAAQAALDGANLQEVQEVVKNAMARTHYFGMVDTLEYLHRGGRLGKAQTFLGSVLNVKPLLAVREGEVFPLERVRGRSRAMGRLCELVEGYNIEKMALSYTTDPGEMEVLAGRLASVFPRGQVYKSRTGSTIGTYLGPRALTAALIEEEAS